MQKHGENCRIIAPKDFSELFFVCKQHNLLLCCFFFVRKQHILLLCGNGFVFLQILSKNHENDRKRREGWSIKWMVSAATQFLMMQRSMEFLWSKQSCILDNIANVETPGYQVKYATFEEALKNAVLSSAQNGISSSSNPEGH